MYEINRGDCRTLTRNVPSSRNGCLGNLVWYSVDMADGPWRERERERDGGEGGGGGGGGGLKEAMWAEQYYIAVCTVHFAGLYTPCGTTN